MADLSQTLANSQVLQLASRVSPFAPDSQDGYDNWGSCTINGVLYTCPNDGYFVIKGAARSYRWDIQNGMMIQGALEFLRGVTPPEFTLEYYFWANTQYATYLAINSGFQYDLKKISDSDMPNSTAAQQTASQLAAQAQSQFKIAQAAANNPNFSQQQKLQLEQQAQDTAAAASAAQEAAQPSPTNVYGNLQVRAITIYHPTLDLVGISAVIVKSVGVPEQQSDDHLWKATWTLQEYFPPIQLPPQDQDTAPQQPNDPLSSSLQDKATQVQDLTQKVAEQKWVSLL
jgi:hypothetical protein